MAKLSKTMQRVMDNLANADHYYKVVGEKWGGITLHSNDDRKNNANSSAWIFFDGRHGITENTKTLEALEKRGLIKIHHVGGVSCDVIEVVGKVNHEPLTKAIEIKVIRVDKERGYKSEFIEYMDHTTTAEQVEKNYNEKQTFFNWSVSVVRDVELTRWDYNN